MQFVTVVGTGVTWVSKRLKQVSAGLGYLEAIHEEMENPRVEPKKPSKEEKKAEQELQSLDAQIATEQHRLNEADRQIAKAQAEIQRIDSGGLVYDFLEGKVRDSRYLDRLGLISVIRQDFEQLAILLEDWRKHGAKSSRVASGDKSNQDNSGKGDGSWDTRPIQRIVLYIDDLDRCPPDRVVEVLQAVHLLLAFELFVVVVAVDPRWLERSLNEKYNTRPPNGGRIAMQDRQFRFSAQNYLEKIFQIPFSIPEMDDGGYKELVLSMTNRPLTRFERSIAKREAEATTLAKLQPRPEAEPAPETVATDDTPSAPSETPDAPPAPETPAPPDQQKQDAALEQPDQQEPEDSFEDERLRKEQEAARKRIAAMLLEDWERDFIASLYPFVSTPRIAKRFLNIYRLLRVTAAKEEGAFAKFIDRENGHYRVVLLLLAISVGRAETGPQILEDISRINTKAVHLSTWLPLAAETYQEEWSKLFDARSKQNAQSGIAEPPSQREKQLESLIRATAEIQASLKGVRARLKSNGGLTLSDRLSLCRQWSCEVGRYSFGWHLKSTSPD
jgi:hypothetical protein